MVKKKINKNCFFTDKYYFMDIPIREDELKYLSKKVIWDGFYETMNGLSIKDRKKMVDILLKKYRKNINGR